MVERWLGDAKMKSFFVVLFILAFLPLTFACGGGHEGSNNLSTMNSNLVHDGSMMNTFHGGGILMFLVYILIIISLVLFIIWMIRILKGGKN